MIDPVNSPFVRPALEPQAAPFVGNLAPAQPQAANPSDFTSMLTGMMGDALSNVRQAEATSLASVHGNASIQQVAEAVLAAEMTLQGAIAVRDKVTAAYLELSRMAI
jgi:flagellar hook-basal body complex protein FliE